MRDRLIELLKFAKSINSERVELQKDEYIYLLEFMEAVTRCRDCKHGQQVGDLGVLCEYGCEEYRPFDHFCGWGERRDFASDAEDE